MHGDFVGKRGVVEHNCASDEARAVVGELTLSHHALTGAWTFVPDPLASGGGFHLRCDGADRVTLSDEPQLRAIP